MKLRVLGCAGGIGGRERLTTCLLLDDDILLDAGTGVATLDIGQLVKIDHVFLSHTHLDHVTGLALLLDAVQGKRSGPVTVHASQKTISALQKHLFNWVLWPDFAAIPNAEKPVLCWHPVPDRGSVTLGTRVLTAHPVNHLGGSCAWQVRDSSRAAGGAGTGNGFVFTGDMATTPELWRALQAGPAPAGVIVDCSFADADRAIAELSLHFCPSMLAEEIRDIAPDIEFLIYHLKPGHEDLIMRELAAVGGGRRFTALKCGDRFDF